MAKRIDYDVKPTPIGPSAGEELDRLLQTLHTHGYLRFANDLAASGAGVAEVVVQGLNKEGTQNAMQNLAILFMALSRIPPSQFYRMAFAVRDAIDGVSAWRPDGGGSDTAPGLTGAYAMLHDDQLWQSLKPLIHGLKVFTERLDSDPEKPITRFSGKPTDA